MSPASVNQQIITQSVTSDQLGTWLEAFLIAKKAENLTPGTIRYYRASLLNFLSYCDSQVVCTIGRLTPDILRRYLIYLEESGHNPGGVHGFYRAVHAFLFWFEEETEPDNWKNPVRRVRAPKLPQEQIEPVSMATVKALVNACPKTFYGLRDRAAVYFLLDTGARASECLCVNLADVDQVSGAVLVREGKGRKPRTVFLAQTARRALRAYLKTRTDNSPALWVTDERERLTYSGLRGIVRRLSERANVEQPALHDFRRAFALACLRNGMDIYSLQNLMGHADLQILRRYLKQTEQDLQAAHSKGSPVEHMKGGNL
jgi:integrase/recombinase XerD